VIWLRAATAAAVALIAALAVAGPASADDVSGAELQALLSAAADDPAAAARLEQVTSIDGRPADLARVLATGPEERAARLAELSRATGSSSSTADGAALSERARELAGEDQQPPERTEEEGGDGSALAPLGVSTPVAIILAAVVVLLAGLLAHRAGQRRLPPARDGASQGDSQRDDENRDSPRSLELQAERAARDGDHATAVRLRFRAGLQRLAGAQAIELRPSLTAGQVARSLPSQRLRALTSTFERVVYGGVAATEEDSAVARRDWPIAVEESTRR